MLEDDGLVEFDMPHAAYQRCTITNIHKDSVILTWQCQQGVMRAMRDVETACQMRSARCSQGVTDQANTF